MTTRIAIVTASAGGKIRIKDPAKAFSGVDYHAFTDDLNTDAKVWKIHELPRWSVDKKFSARRDAKLPKILPELLLPGYDYYIWHDPTNEIVADPGILIKYLPLGQSNDFAVFKHSLRNCVFDESRTVLKYSLDTSDNVNRQIGLYKKLGYPLDNGLYELGVIVKRKTGESLRLSLAWWEQINRYSSRDQLSFPFVLWSHSLEKPVLLPGNVFYNDIVPRVCEPDKTDVRIHFLTSFKKTIKQSIRCFVRG